MSDTNRIGSHCFYRRCVNPDAPYRERNYQWLPGILRHWGTDYLDCGESGPAHFPCAVVEDRRTLDVYSVHVQEVSFNSIPPNM